MVIGELHKVHQGVIFQDEGELISSWAPVGDAWSDAQVHLERHLSGTHNSAMEISENYAIAKGSEDKTVASRSLEIWERAPMRTPLSPSGTTQLSTNSLPACPTGGQLP